MKIKVNVFDPIANPSEVKEFEFDLIQKISKYDAIILASNPKQFMKLEIENLKIQESVIFDLKAVLDQSKVDARL